jgi:hypothetical protein
MKKKETLKERFAKNEKVLPKEIVNQALTDGLDRAVFWKYPLEGPWTTSVKASGYEFEVHKPANGECGILNFSRTT